MGQTRQLHNPSTGGPHQQAQITSSAITQMHALEVMKSHLLENARQVTMVSSVQTVLEDIGAQVNSYAQSAKKIPPLTSLFRSVIYLQRHWQ